MEKQGKSGFGLGTYSCVTAIIAGILSVVPILFIFSAVGNTKPTCDACAGMGMIMFILLGIAIGVIGGAIAVVLAVVGLITRKAGIDGGIAGIILGLAAAATPFLLLLMMAK